MVNDGEKARIRTIQSCVSCALCSNLLREATTICSCLHTFCRECIYQKLENDGTNCCPVCNVYLGCHPEDKLRPDNSLQNLRMKIFPVKNSSELETKSSRASLTKRKEKSISSLTVTATPSVSGSKKAMSRGTSRKASMSKKAETDFPGKDMKGVIKNPSSSSSHEGLNKFPTSSKKPVILGIEDQSHDIIAQSESDTQPQCSLNNQDEGPKWESLSVLAETANRAENLNMDLFSVPAYNMVNNDEPHKKPTRRLSRRAGELKSGQTSTIVNVENDDLPSKITTPNTDGALKINDSNEQCIGASNASGSSGNMENNDNPHMKQTRRLMKSVRELKSGQASTIVNVENDDLPSKITTPNADGTLKINDSNKQRIGALKINDSNEQCIIASNASGSLDNMENNDNPHLKQTRGLSKNARELKSGQTSTIVNVENDDLPSKITTLNADAALKINDSNEQCTGAYNASGSSDNFIRRLHPVWFVMLACINEERTPFPQIPMVYNRIKDGSVPVAYLSKYVAKKLNLSDASEVEVMCCGQAAPPNATLLDLVNIWENSESNMDSSNDDAEDFVMVLTYRRK